MREPHNTYIAAKTPLKLEMPLNESFEKPEVVACHEGQIAVPVSICCRPLSNCRLRWTLMVSLSGFKPRLR